MTKSKIITALFGFTLLGGMALSVSAQTKVSQPGVYSGYAKPVADGWQRISQYVAVRDGTKLAVDYYRPTLKGVLVTTPFPVIWQFTPYRRALYDNDSKVISRQAAALLELTRYGYVMAVADVRGKGASFGFRKAMRERWIHRALRTDGSLRAKFFQSDGTA